MSQKHLSRLGVLVAGAAVVTAFTSATAAAAAPGPMEGPAAGPTRPDPGPATGAGTPPPGFLLERGRFTPVVPPPGLEDLYPDGLAPFDLDDRGQIVGPYVDLAAQAARGFLLTRDRLLKVDVPGAKATQPQGINNRGQIVGKYSNTTGDMTAPGALIRGFLLDRGRYVRLDVPGAVTSQAFRGDAGRGRARTRSRGDRPGPRSVSVRGGDRAGGGDRGTPPLPRVARPFIQGLFARPPADNPTLVNNVETLANVPHILADGPDWLRANGTEAAPGTMVFTICGDVLREGCSSYRSGRRCGTWWRSWPAARQTAGR